MHRNLRPLTGTSHSKWATALSRRYIPTLLEMVQSKMFYPEFFLTKTEPLSSAIEAYKSFDQHKQGWLKVEVVPGM